MTHQTFPIVTSHSFSDDKLHRQLRDAFRHTATLSPQLQIVEGEKIYLLLNGCPLGRPVEDYVEMESQGVFPSTYGLNVIVQEVVLPLRSDPVAFNYLHQAVEQISCILVRGLHDPLLRKYLNLLV